MWWQKDSTDISPANPDHDKPIIPDYKQPPHEHEPDVGRDESAE